METVIKVGGSLSQSRKLADLMARFSELGHRHRILIVPGGGAFANAIRYYDRRFGLDTDASHWMAILAMDQFGHLISSLIPDSELVQGLADARKISASGRVSGLAWAIKALRRSGGIVIPSIRFDASVDSTMATSRSVSRT